MRKAARITDSMPVVRTRRATVALWLVGGVFVVALGAALDALAAVMIPTISAILIALVVAPLHRRLAEALPDKLRWIALVGVFVLLIAVVAAFAGALIYAADQVVETLPDVSGDIDELLPRSGGGSGRLGGQLREAVVSLTSTLGDRLISGATSLAQTLASGTGVFLTGLALVIFLVLLALDERGLWRDKVNALWPESGPTDWAGALSVLARRLRRFLLVRTGVGLLQAALYAGWLWLFGIDLVFVFALLTFVLTYIPNIGSVIASLLPVTYALLTKDFGTALGVAAGLLVIEQVVGNFLDPRLLGREIALSPFVILVGLVFWSALWGIAGAFLSTPILLCLLVAFNAVGPLKPLALILSNQPDPQALDRALAQA